MYLEGNIWGDTGQIQNFIRHGPGKPGLVGPALSRGLELQDVQRPSQSQLFHDSSEEWRINQTHAIKPSLMIWGYFFLELMWQTLKSKTSSLEMRTLIITYRIQNCWKLGFRRYAPPLCCWEDTVEIYLGIHGRFLPYLIYTWKEATSTEFSGVLGFQSHDLTWFHSPVFSLCS